METNPLNSIILDRRIDIPITKHFEENLVNDFHRDFFTSDVHKIYHIQFIIGLLTSIASSKGTFKDIFFRRVGNKNLRIFVVQGEKIIFHNIFYEPNTNEALPTLTKYEKYVLEKTIKDLKLGVASNKDFQSFEYLVKMVPKNRDSSIDHFIMSLEMVEEWPLQRWRLDNIEKIESKISFLELTEQTQMQRVASNEELFQVIHRKHKFKAQSLKSMVDFTIPHWSIGQFPHNDPIAKAALSQGFIFKTISDRYHNILRQSPLPIVSYRNGALSMCLPENRLHDSYALFTFPPKRTAGYHLLLAVRRKDITIHEMNIRMMNENRKIDERFVKLSLEHIFEDMSNDILVRGDVTTMREYSEIIRNFFKLHGVFSMEHMKAFSLGLLRTVPSAHMSVSVGLASGVLESMIFEHNGVKIWITFDAASKKNLATLTKSTPQRDIIQLNFEPGFEISVSSISNSDLQQAHYFKAHGPLEFNDILQKMVSGSHEAPPIDTTRKLQYTLDSLINNIRHIPEIYSNLHMYFAGMASHCCVWRYKETMEWEHQKGELLYPVRRGNQIKKIYFKFTSREQDVARSVLAPGQVDPSHLMSIAYNAETDKVAIIGLDQETQQFTTDDVLKICTSGRRKRNSFSFCSSITNQDQAEYNKDDDSFKIGDEQVKKMITTKNDKLKAQLEKVYEISGKIQLAFVSRDLIGDAVRGDVEGLVRDGLFFGGITLAQEAGDVAAMYGKSVGSAGIASAGLCLPNLAFDAYMAYQMVQQIKQNDTINAVGTGVFIALDVAKCVLEAMAEFGILALNPWVIPAMMIGNVAILIGQNIYDTVKKIKEIDHVVHLSTDEYMYEFVREFLKMGTDPYIQHLADEKQANEQIASRLFEIYPNIKRFVVSAAIYNEHKSITFIDDNRIDLTRTGPIERKSRAMPEMKKNRTYFCAMSQEPHSPSLSQMIVNTIMYSSIWRILQSLTHKEIQQEFQDFQCLNAFGVSTADAHHSEKTMFLLFDGVDNVNGFPYASNIFHVGNGSKFIQGGDCDDYFKIIAENVNGIFNAGNGYDTLDLSEFSHQPLTIRGGIAVQRYAGRLEGFKFANIESIIGRRNFSDYLSVCNQSRIDLAGTNYNLDKILIRNDVKNDCLAPKNLTVYLRRTTNVICHHPEAKVTYLVMRDTIAIVKAYNGSHHFYFQGLDLIDITVVTFDKDTLFLKFGDKEAGSSLIVNNLSNVSMEFNDGVKIKSSGNSLVAHLERPETLFDVIEKYDQFIKNNKFMTLVAETIQGRAILHHDHNLIEINGTSKSMNIIVNSDKLDVDLIGQVNASNYFLLFGNQFDWSHEIDLKIYTHNSMSYIDLHLLARSIHQKTNGEDGLHVWAKKSLDDTTNIELKIRAMPNKDDVAPVDLGKITIINGVKNIDKILINIYNTNLLSLIDENVGKVTLDPLLSYKSGSIIAILPGQLDFYSKISVDSLLGENFEPFFVNGTLMLTNLASQAIFLEVEIQMMTIFLYDFKMYKNKYRTIDLVFKEQTLKLDNYVKMSSGIKPIDAFWNILDE